MQYPLLTIGQKNKQFYKCGDSNQPNTGKRAANKRRIQPANGPKKKPRIEGAVNGSDSEDWSDGEEDDSDSDICMEDESSSEEMDGAKEGDDNKNDPGPQGDKPDKPRGLAV